MIHHLPADAQLSPQTLGAGYDGPETYRSGDGFETADGAVSAGIWSYAGRLASTNAGASHQLWAVIEGTITVVIDGARVVGTRGDLIGLEAPYPAKVVTCSDDFKAVWIAINTKETT